ncbi:MAG TPA: 50S ribosomal protein L4 [Dehalococcoidia bacterium]|nr:50S ribosomal protein L4 [Dehalococcoidia bacterium]
MKLTVYDISGKEVGSMDVDDLVFGLTPNRAVLRQALLAQLANRRAGSANTKTRGEVAGSTRKIRRQKGMGAARQGAIRAPHHRHGGISFGPKPRSFRQALPKRVRRLAIRSALSAKAGEGELKVVRGLDLEAPKTRAIKDMLSSLDLNRSALVVTAAANRNLLLSSRNLPGAKALAADYLNVADLFSFRGLVMTEDAVRRTEALWGGERATKRIAPAPEAVTHG